MSGGPVGGAGGTCPSSPAEPGTVLLGIGGPSGVAYFTPSVTVDEPLLEQLRRDGPPEQRFRFAGPCAQGGCGHWTGAMCGLIDEVIDAVDELPTGPDRVADVREQRGRTLPTCSIRTTCRWFAQRGADACAVCPLVVTQSQQTTPATTG